MKRGISGFVFFLAVFAVGTWIGGAFLHQYSRNDTPDYEVTSGDVADIPQMVEVSPDSKAALVPEFTNVHLPAEFENGDFRYLLRVDKGETVIGKCEFAPQMKGQWMGLFTRKSRYFLQSVNLKFGRAEKDDFGTYIPLHFHDSRKADFLFNDDGRIKPGPVTTLFITPQANYDDMLVGTGFRKELAIGGRIYLLRVSTGLTDSGNSVEVLVLESGNKQDMLYYSWPGESNFGQIEWAGDLDGDKELDLIFSYFDVNGGGLSSILFLSSAAKENHLVQPYAFFHSADKGC
jgi:hypothetical protein